MAQPPPSTADVSSRSLEANAQQLASIASSESVRQEKPQTSLLCLLGICDFFAWLFTTFMSLPNPISLLPPAFQQILRDRAIQAQQQRQQQQPPTAQPPPSAGTAALPVIPHMSPQRSLTAQVTHVSRPSQGQQSPPRLNLQQLPQISAPVQLSRLNIPQSSPPAPVAPRLVNPKQFRRIMKRREERAKQGPLPPYSQESRVRVAKARPRTKKGTFAPRAGEPPPQQTAPLPTAITHLPPITFDAMPHQVLFRLPSSGTVDEVAVNSLEDGCDDLGGRTVSSKRAREGVVRDAEMKARPSKVPHQVRIASEIRRLPVVPVPGSSVASEEKLSSSTLTQRENLAGAASLVLASKISTCQASNMTRLFKDPSLPYISCFDKTLGVPLWTAHFLPSTFSPTKGRPGVSTRHVPTDLIGYSGKSFRPSPDGKRWDRGHLSPNADFESTEDKRTSFSIINRAPQLSELDQNFWRCTEGAVRELPRSLDLDILVITLLQFSKSPIRTPEIQGFDTAIPSHYSKIVYALDKDGQAIDAACVQLQNSQYDHHLDMHAQPSTYYPNVYEWTRCPEEIKSGAATPTNQSLKLTAHLKEQLYQDASVPSSIKCDTHALVDEYVDDLNYDESPGNDFEHIESGRLLCHLEHGVEISGPVCRGALKSGIPVKVTFRARCASQGEVSFFDSMEGICLVGAPCHRRSSKSGTFSGTFVTRATHNYIYIALSPTPTVCSIVNLQVYSV